MKNNDASAPRRPRVLLVDDNTEARRAMARLLEISGFEVTDAADGATALEAMEAAPPPDFVLTDLILPGDLDGLAVARRARLLSPRPRIALITGWEVDAGSLGGGVDPDFDWIFEKPVDLREMIARLLAPTPDKRNPS